MDNAFYESGFVNSLSILSGFRGPLNYRFSGILRILYWLYAGMMDLFMFGAWFTVSSNFLSPGVSLPERCTSGFPTMVISMSVFHHFYFFHYRRRFVKLLQGYVMAFEGDEELEEQVKSFGRYFKMLPWVLVMLMVVVMGPFCFSPLIREFSGKPRILAVPAKYPFDPYSSTTVFVLTSLFQTMNGLFIPMRVIVFDNTFYSYACRQLALTRRLTAQLREILRVSRIDDSGAVTFRDQEGKELARRAAEEATLQALRMWVIKHQQSLRQLKELERLYSPAFLIEFFLLCLQVCTNAFVVTSVDLDFVGLVSCAVYVLGNLTQLLFSCRIGDLIYLVGEELPAATLGSHMQTLSREVNTFLRIILTRAKVPLRLTAFGVFQLNTETFKSISLSAYSYFTMLNKIKH